MSSELPELLWPCHFCGLETTQISDHLERAHGKTAEDVVQLLDERDRRRLFAEQMLLARQEIAEAAQTLFGMPIVEDSDFDE